MRVTVKSFVICFLLTNIPVTTLAADKVNAYVLNYAEKEEGTDFYPVKYTVTDLFLRIDDSIDDNSDQSHDSGNGYIVFDVKKNTIYSVSHFDESILVIPKYDVSTQGKNKIKSSIDYQKEADAPVISGKPIYRYKVSAKSASKSTSKEGSDVCMDIQLAEGLLPKVTKQLKQFQSVIAAQQIKNIKVVPEEFRTPCFMVDQVYNAGDYYAKGLPVYEWHSNEKVRSLTSYSEESVDSSLFDLPEGYREYRLDEAFQ